MNYEASDVIKTLNSKEETAKIVKMCQEKIPFTDAQTEPEDAPAPEEVLPIDDDLPF